MDSENTEIQVGITDNKTGETTVDTENTETQVEILETRGQYQEIGETATHQGNKVKKGHNQE